jgi:hypothetical protein
MVSGEGKCQSIENRGYTEEKAFGSKYGADEVEFISQKALKAVLNIQLFNLILA